MPQPVYRRLACALLMLALAACQGAESPRPTTTAPTSAIGAAVPPSPGLERSRNEANKDDALKALLTRRLAELDRRSYRGVTVEVWGGRALLMGAVSKPEQRRKAEQVAAATDGIGEVLNELVLAEDKALDAFTPDPAREETVRRALGIEGRAGTVVRVVNGVAFLLGAAPDADSAATMKADAGMVEGIKWVVSHLKTGQ
jgi:osmotically-inducible protein OsmY